MSTIHLLAADLANRCPALAQDPNKAEAVITGLLQDALGNKQPGQCNTCRADILLNGLCLRCSEALIEERDQLNRQNEAMREADQPRAQLAAANDDKLLLIGQLEAARERAAAANQRAEQTESDLTKVLGVIQRLQPVGSPPPTDTMGTVKWIVTSVAEQISQLRADKEKAETELRDANNAFDDLFKLQPITGMPRGEVLRRLVSDKEKAEAACAEMYSAIEVMVSKLHVIHKDPRYKAVWFTSQNHLGPYEGPQYAEDLCVLEGIVSRMTCGKGWVSPEQLGPTIGELHRLSDVVCDEDRESIEREIDRLQKLTEGK